MPENETLGASFSIDVTSLKAGLAQANRLIRESESEFRAAAAGMDDWRESQEGLQARIKHLNNACDLQRKKVDALQSEYDRLIADGLDPTSDAAIKLRTDINKEKEALAKNEKELKKQTEALEDMGAEAGDAADAIAEAGDAAEDAGDGFTIAKGAAAGLVSQGIATIAGACKDAITGLLDLSESTREFRSVMASLTTSSERAGYTTAETEKVFRELVGVLGDTQGAATTTANLQAIGLEQEKLQKLTTGVIGAWAAYGDSIPIDGLSEAVNHTIKLGETQGTLADVLEWGGRTVEDFNAQLAECNTKSERADLILKMLADQGLSDAGKAWEENNESIIKANEAQYEFEKGAADLGEEIEPVTTNIKQMKTALYKELTPTIKKDVIPAIEKFADKGTNIATKILPPLSKAVSFVAENIDTLVGVTLTAVTVYKSFSAAMAVSTAITSAKTAIAGLSAGVGVATKAQTVWNAAMTANPIGAVITAAALLAGGIALLVSAIDDATESTDYLTESQRETVTAAEEAAAAYRDQKDAAADLAAAEYSNIEYTRTLWAELQTLADESGKVKSTDKERAEFILGELNDALGTEYGMNGDIIEQYQQMKSSIEDVIKTKQAQILLEAQEESYKKAVENVAAAEAARAAQAQALAAAEKARDEAEEKRLARLQELRKQGYSDFAAMKDQTLLGYTAEVQRLTSTLSEKEEAYKKSTANVEMYYKDISDYQNASTLLMQGKTEEAVGYLNNLNVGYQTAASTAELSAEEQKKVLEQQVIDTEINARLLKESYEKGVEGVSEEMVKVAKEQADAAKAEFYKVGGDITKGIADGAEGEEWTLTGAMQGLIDAAVNAAKKRAGIKSPARAFKKPVGGMIGLGVARGIDDSTADAVKSAKKQIVAIRDAYDIGAISASVSSAIAPPVRNGGATSGAGGKSVIVNQTNHYSQAHSRIELYKTKINTEAAVRLAMAGA